jgi:uncharacterized membrane protein
MGDTHTVGNLVVVISLVIGLIFTIASRALFRGKSWASGHLFKDWLRSIVFSLFVGFVAYSVAYLVLSLIVGIYIGLGMLIKAICLKGFYGVGHQLLLS